MSDYLGTIAKSVIVGFFFASFFASSSKATDFDGSFASTDDYGDVGLIQVPTARMRPDGEWGIGISSVDPYKQVHLFLQFFPWLETAVRYTDVTNRSYGPQYFSGNQAYKDKSGDLKIRLLRESTYWPSVAIGIQDFGGTGLFSSQYIVNSFHYYDLDLTFGFAWGRLGTRGGIKNPLTLISSHFNRDQSPVQSDDRTGTLGLGNLFIGRKISPIGGIQWRTPLKGLAVQAEYDGNNYRAFDSSTFQVTGQKSLKYSVRQSIPVNFALNYTRIPDIDFGLGYERGNTIMFKASLHLNFHSFRGLLKSDDPQPLPVRSKNDESQLISGAQSLVIENAPPNGSAPSGSASVSNLEGNPIPAQVQSDFVLRLKAAMAEQGFYLSAFDFNPFNGEARIWMIQPKFNNPAQAIGRAARVLSNTAPAEVSKFTFTVENAGVEIYRVSLSRDGFERVARGEADLDDLSAGIVFSSPRNDEREAEYADAPRYPGFSWDMGPGVRQYIGGPDGFYFGQLYWKLYGDVSISKHLTLSSAVGINIYNNFDQIKQENSNSVLPHVRSDIVKYLKKGENDLIKLEANYIWSPAPDLYSRVSVGIFEEMYAGVASEVLYRPYGLPWALGVNINRVKQRDYHELFAFRGYMVTTGNVTLYYHLPIYNLLAVVSAGRYLAKDKGVTLDISRRFASGIIAGIFGTKTNVSAQQFGEGSFDKGIYLALPLNLFSSQSTRQQAILPFRPLTRDGGQKVRDGQDLYSVVEDGQPEDFAGGWEELLH